MYLQGKESEVLVMYRYFIMSESLVIEGCTSCESNTYPLDRETCERKLAKALKSIAINGSRRVLRSWIEEVTE